MKRNANFILYAVALAVILIPMIAEQCMGRSMNQLAETMTLCAGLVLLLIGKAFVIKRKHAETGESIFLDVVICVCLVCMVIWMIAK